MAKNTAATTLSMWSTIQDLHIMAHMAKRGTLGEFARDYVNFRFTDEELEELNEFYLSPEWRIVKD